MRWLLEAGCKKGNKVGICEKEKRADDRREEACALHKSRNY